MHSDLDMERGEVEIPLEGGSMNSISPCLLRSSQYERGARAENSLAKHCLENTLWKKIHRHKGRVFLPIHHNMIISNTLQISYYIHTNGFLTILAFILLLRKNTNLPSRWIKA